MVVEIFLFLVASYLILGFCFAIFFILKGAKILDPVVKSSSVSFCLLLMPASVLIWPWLLIKILRRG